MLLDVNRSPIIGARSRSPYPLKDVSKYLFAPGVSIPHPPPQTSLTLCDFASSEIFLASSICDVRKLTPRTSTPFSSARSSSWLDGYSSTSTPSKFSAINLMPIAGVYALSHLCFARLSIFVIKFGVSELELGDTKSIFQFRGMGLFDCRTSFFEVRGSKSCIG